MHFFLHETIETWDWFLVHTWEVQLNRIQSTIQSRGSTISTSILIKFLARKILISAREIFVKNVHDLKLFKECSSMFNAFYLSVSVESSLFFSHHFSCNVLNDFMFGWVVVVKLKELQTQAGQRKIDERASRMSWILRVVLWFLIWLGSELLPVR